MKKFCGLILAFLVFAGLSFTANAAEAVKGEVSFNWDKLSQTERDNDILAVKNKIFTKDVVYSYDSNEFEQKYSAYKKDASYKANMLLAKLGKTDLEDRILVPFYVKKLLYGYGIIYKSDLKRCYYYTALGGLFNIEIFQNDYNKYPVVSYQYDKKGRLNSAVYSVSDIDEYMYAVNGTFVGRWYKENYYNSKGKVIMTRTLPQN